MPFLFQNIASKHVHIAAISLCLCVLSACANNTALRDSVSLDRKTPAPVVQAPLRVQSEPIPADGQIIVRTGDDIFTIAARYKVNPLSILIDNELADTSLVVGQKLYITPRRTHIVTITDTLFSISQRYAVSQFQLAQLNGLTEPFEIVAGQVLILPDSQDLAVLNLEGLDTGAVKPQQQAVRTTTITQAAPKRPVKKFVAPALGSSGFNWPLSGEVIGEYGPVAKGIHNDGINIAAEAGTAVNTTAAGTVAYVGENLKSFGSLVLVKHEGGYISAYAHLSSIVVSEGDVLSAGTLIGQVGQTGNVDTPQLHFDIRKSRQPINPRDLISS